MLYIVITIITIITIYIFFKLHSNKLVFQKSTIDGRNYLVNNLIDKQEAADTLAEIRRRIILLVSKLSPDFKYQDGLLDKVKTMDIMENPIIIPDPSVTSYTINKSKFVFCLRDSATGKIHEINTLMYITLHELGHVCSPEFGHTELWQSIFKDLIKEGIRVGVYEDQNYVTNPINYCGLIVDERLI
jgi:hypothetical protein